MVVLLEAAVRGSSRRRVDLEVVLEVAPGYLGELFAGRVPLEVRHLLLLARELGLDPSLLFEEGLKGGSAGAEPGDPALTEIEGAFRQLQGGRAPAGSGEPTLELDAVKELIRETIRDELSRMANPPARKPRSRGVEDLDLDEPLP